MPPLFVPEEEWGPGSWRVNHPNTVDAQIDHGLERRRLRRVGLLAVRRTPRAATASSASTRSAWTRTATPRTSTAHARRPRVRAPGLPAAARRADPPPSAYTNGVVTPHATFLGLRWRPREALASLAKLERDFGAFTKWGFYDAVNVDTGQALGLVPVARPGDDHGRARQRARPRRAARRVRHARRRARDPPGGRRRGVQRRSRAAARSPAPRARTGCAGRAATT